MLEEAKQLNYVLSEHIIGQFMFRVDLKRS